MATNVAKSQIGPLGDPHLGPTDDPFVPFGRGRGACGRQIGARLVEATASVDTETERRIQKALERLLAGRTSLVIAHRLSTIQRADRILVLHRGRLVEQGSHRELLARGGLYRRLHELQSRDPARVAGG